MKNVMENKKLNDKGFSLVELIIVIAIMAVLIGVLAPQYIKYVEKSRKAADGTAVDEIASAMQVLASDTDISLDKNKKYEVTMDSNYKMAITSELSSLLSNYNVSSGYEFKSQDYKDKQSSFKLSLVYSNEQWNYKEEGLPAD